MANATCCACAAAEAATEEGSVAFAFAISFGAGMCTAVGGAMSFYGEIEDTRILAISLAVSAGVMIYVSFIEIFVKSVGGFTDQFVLDGNSQDDADRYAYYAATSFFFVGCMLTKLIDHGLGKIQERAAKETITGAEGICECEIPGTGYAAHEGKPAKLSVLTRDSDGQAQLGDADTVMSLFDQDKDGGLNTTELGQLVSLINADLVACAGGDDGARPAEIEGMGRTKAAMARIGESLSPLHVSDSTHPGAQPCNTPYTSGCACRAGALEAAKLQQMGLFTALSIFIHNFPEGLATFIAT
jgi:ZIP family zinc transporter